MMALIFSWGPKDAGAPVLLHRRQANNRNGYCKLHIIHTILLCCSASAATDSLVESGCGADATATNGGGWYNTAKKGKTQYKVVVLPCRRSKDVSRSLP